MPWIRQIDRYIHTLSLSKSKWGNVSKDPEQWLAHKMFSGNNSSYYLIVILKNERLRKQRSSEEPKMCGQRETFTSSQSGELFTL